VCPVPNCITMVNESAFQDNASQWEAFRKDKAGYTVWLKTVVVPAGERSHGFRYRGQYKEQIPAAMEIAKG